MAERQMSSMIDLPKTAASTARQPSDRAQIFEAAAMTAFIVLMFLFVEVAPALVN
jgi:hypothetical protein